MWDGEMEGSQTAELIHVQQPGWYCLAQEVQVPFQQRAMNDVR